jgi:chromosome segregation ATPase
MSDQVWIAVLGTLGVILGGAGAKRLADRWFTSVRDRTKAETDERTRKSKADDLTQTRQFTDNEEARRWLSGQLTERDRDLGEVLNRERALLEKVGELSSHVAQLAERSASQAIQIDELKTTVAKWGQDYQEMKAERDEMRSERDRYRNEKHSSDNQLTAVQLRAQMTESALAAATAEIERLKGQVDALSKKSS